MFSLAVLSASGPAAGIVARRPYGSGDARDRAATGWRDRNAARAAAGRACRVAGGEREAAGGEPAVGAPGELAKIRRWKSSVVREVTNPYLSPSRAIVPARERAKRRQGRRRAGLLSNERVVIRSAEVFNWAEGHTDRTARVRSGRAPRCRRTHARMYDRSRELGDLCATAALASRSLKSRQKAERRTHGAEEVGLGHSSEEVREQSAGSCAAEWMERRAGRNGRREGRAMLRTPSREAPRGLEAGRERSGTESP